MMTNLQTNPADRHYIATNHVMYAMTHDTCKPGLTYIMHGSDIYKIGMTKGNRKALHQRLKYFNQVYGVQGEIVMLFRSSCAVCLEKYLQGCFLDKRLMGIGQEIFSLTKDDLQWVVDNVDELIPRPVELLEIAGIEL